MPVGSGGEVHNAGVHFTATTNRHFVLSPVSLASRDQDGGPSNSTIGIYDLTEKQGTVNSLISIRMAMLVYVEDVSLY